MTEVFLKLINMSITAGWIVLAVILLRFLLKKAPKAITCMLWALVAIRLVFPFSIESVLSLIPSAKTVPEEIVYAREPVINSGVPIINQAVNPIITHSFAPPNTLTSINPIQVFLAVAANLWILGMIAMVLYAAISYLRLQKQIAEAVETEKGIFVCDRISTPFILGIFRPRIILPSAMAEADREYVLAHERAHLRRRDHLWKPLGFVLLTVYWFNPVLWVAYILLCRDIELACDERVIREMGTEEKKAYTTALLNCSVPRRMIAACPLAFGEVGVKQRIRNALHYKKPAFWIIAAAIVASIVFAVCFLTDPKAEEELPEIYGHSYRVSEVVYGAPHLSYMMFAGENTPVYTITDDMHLLRKEADADAEWEYEGELRSFILSPETFDQKFMEFAWSWSKHDSTIVSLRDNNANMWYLPYSDGLCYVLQQKDGSIYLAYGHAQNLFDWVFKLKEDVTEDTGWIVLSRGETVPLILSDAPIEEVKDLVHWLDTDFGVLDIYCDGMLQSGVYTLYDAETMEEVVGSRDFGEGRYYIFDGVDGRDYIVAVHPDPYHVFYFGARWSGFPETFPFFHETTVAYAGYISDYAIITGALNRDKMMESSIQHLPIYKFESVAELAKFQSDFAEDIATRAHGEVPCFDVVAKQYDAEFFEEKALLIVYVESGSGSCRYDVGSVVWSAESNSLVVHAELTRSPVTADMAGWFLCVAMNKDTVQNCTTFDADLNAVSHADKLIGKWSAFATNMGILDDETPQYSELSYIFFADGKGVHTVDEHVSEFTYTTEGRLLHMRFARASGMEDVKTFVYMVNGDTLTLTDELAAYRSATLTKAEMDADAVYITQPLTEDEAKLLQEWCGAYQYDEFWLNPNNGVYEGITYEIDVYMQENGVYARFRANGFQTMIDAIARVKGNQERIELYPIWISTDSFPVFSMDTLLLALYKEDGVIKTQWGTWAPDIQEEDSVYFERNWGVFMCLFIGQDLPSTPKAVDRFSYHFKRAGEDSAVNIDYLDNGMLQVTENGNFVFSFSIYQDGLPYVEPLYTLLDSIVTVDYEGNRFDTLSLANEHITITLNGQKTTVSEVRLGAGNGHRDFYITFATDVMLDLREIRSFSIEVE